jgi:hypothetical protein
MPLPCTLDSLPSVFFIDSTWLMMSSPSLFLPYTSRWYVPLIPPSPNIELYMHLYEHFQNVYQLKSDRAVYCRGRDRGNTEDRDRGTGKLEVDLSRSGSTPTLILLCASACAICEWTASSCGHRIPCMLASRPLYFHLLANRCR